jgi:CDP-glucose 4,6-dehydratase
LVSAAYRSSFFNPADYARHGTAVATARAGNAIGGGDWSANRLIPDAMRAFAEQRPLQVRHPAAIRPWQHVLDPLAGYLLLAEQLYDRDPAPPTRGTSVRPVATPTALRRSSRN